MNAEAIPHTRELPDETEHPLISRVRLVICHKHSTSARLRFMRLPWGVTLFEPLPDGATLDEEQDAGLRAHPAACVQLAARWLDMPTSSLQAETDFYQRVSLADGNTLEIVLLRVAEMDPPFAAAERYEGQFVDLIDARNLQPIELGLLRNIYCHMLGG